MLHALVRLKGHYEHGTLHAQGSTELDLEIALLEFDFTIEGSVKLASVHASGGNPAFQIRRATRLQEILSEACNRIGGLAKLTSDIGNLRDLRNLVQHGGAAPNEADVRRFRTTSLDVLDIVSAELVQTSFASLDPAMMVKNQALRQVLSDSHKALDESERGLALVLAKLAFDESLNARQGQERRESWRPDPYFAWMRLEEHLNNALGRSDGRDIRSALEHHERVIAVIMQGVDVQTYPQFDRATSSVHVGWFMNGGVSLTASHLHEVAEGDARLASDFATRAVLGWESSLAGIPETHALLTELATKFMSSWPPGPDGEASVRADP